MHKRIKRINWDAIGIAATVACAIHCALLPLFLSTLPLFGMNIINNDLFEIGMIALAFCIGIYSLLHGFKRHHHKITPMIILAAGFVFLVLKQLFHNNEQWLLFPAVALIVTAHLLNYSFCRKADHCHSTDCEH